VLVVRTGGVFTITLNRPGHKNALDDRCWHELAAAFEDAATDPEVRVVVISGAGGNFCAGADLSGRAAEEHPISRLRRIGNVAIALSDLPKPVIAKVDGLAVGAGWNLALSCDLVVASTRARFSQIYARRGMSIDFGGSWLLPRVVGLQQAKRLTFLASIIDAQEALRIGAVTWVKSPEELDSFVDDLAGHVAAMPPMALTQAKSLLNRGSGQTLRDAIESEARAQAVNYATEDAPMALRAFLAKSGTPHYTGRWAVPLSIHDEE
jgi:2-(1,2-epoxy-1,2-dihydrophenyl)acetyl-CoA isomerase